MGTSCAPLLDLFLYSYEANFILALLKKNEKKLYTPYAGAAGMLLHMNG
jgi:hypothetical protein